MKKGLLKLFTFLLTFIVALIVVNKIMNEGHDNLTMEMAQASLPLVVMERDGVRYNRLHGYTVDMEETFQRDTVTVLGENRDLNFVVETFGETVVEVYVEVRTADGGRLIENTKVENLRVRGEEIRGAIALKDLIEKDTEYSLTLRLVLDNGQDVAYYTRAIWSENLYVEEKLDYVLDFHQRLYDREAAKILTKYLETNANLEDNTSFHKVNIHSSFRQITWDELNVKEFGKPDIRLTEIANQTASFLVDYIVYTAQDRAITYYTVEEFYRIRYTADRIYLLDYERTMTQIPNEEQMYANDKILLGITENNIPMIESADGNIIVFEIANQLFSYNITTNKLAVIFRFYDKENGDARTIYNQHGIRILSVDEGGNVAFAVYGYMNRGRHEGEVGVQIYTYNSTLNTLEELLYIPYDNPYSVLASEMEQLLYLNRDQKLYLMLNQAVYCIDLEGRGFRDVIQITQDEGMMVSENHKILVWSQGRDIYQSPAINIRNFSTDSQTMVSAERGEVILPLGFMDEDIIYGIAHATDVKEENSGRIFYPMYKICICDSSGKLLKEYKQENIYVADCSVEENQITLQRLKKQEDGTYVETTQDHIMNNMEVKAGDNVITTAVIDRYKSYVQIRLKKAIDVKAIQILTPKEVMYEGDREIVLPKSQIPRYYVYGAYGVSGIYTSPANAVSLAYDIGGVVVNDSGECIWLKGNRLTKNQIMAIKEPEQVESDSSLAVCLDTIFKFEGLVRDAQGLLAQGKTPVEIMRENLAGVEVLDMTGCNLDAMLYYVNQDFPVLAVLRSGEAVLVTGFNTTQVVIMEPASGKLYKKSMTEADAWFEENGNCFITYVRKQ